jgi:hypothetical protein
LFAHAGTILSIRPIIVASKSRSSIGLRKPILLEISRLAMP